MSWHQTHPLWPVVPLQFGPVPAGMPARAHMSMCGDAPHAREGGAAVGALGQNSGRHSCARSCGAAAVALGHIGSLRVAEPTSLLAQATTASHESSFCMLVPR
eukprot:scaffold4120_cov400-Prasinococcus_capsulatus_cf.AAC.26